MLSNSIDRNDYNISSSESAQANFETVASQLESALDRRDADVRRAMADYTADGVSELYRGVENQWYTAGGAVRDIIKQIRTSLSENDGVARTALAAARNAIPGA